MTCTQISKKIMFILIISNIKLKKIYCIRKEKKYIKDFLLVAEEVNFAKLFTLRSMEFIRNKLENKIVKCFDKFIKYHVNNQKN